MVKIIEFLSMRKNLSDPKSTVDLDDIPEDEEFSKLWNKEHHNEFDSDDEAGDDDYEIAEYDVGIGQVKYGYRIFLSEVAKEKYSLGAKIVEKMGYDGSVLGCY